jgi:beta-lactamase superfamily II metal-dependent hydrolase
LIDVTFKNVGQGDSIIVEWDDSGTLKLGIIDCNIFEDSNPVVDYLSTLPIKEIEFVILSHFHYDHYSGFPGLFDFCFKNKIAVKLFLHSLSEHIFDILNRVFISMREQKTIQDFFNNRSLIGKLIHEDISVNYTTKTFSFSKDISLSFLAPKINVTETIGNQLRRKVNTKKFQKSDINKFSTITLLEGESGGILFTSDAVKRSFNMLHEKIDKQIKLIQVPHHGSYLNINTRFWGNIKREDKCLAVFSVGHEPKDKLPNKETVEYLDNIDYDITSTNYVFGIAEYFPNQGQPANKHARSQYLNHFSKKRNRSYSIPATGSKYSGDKHFSISL